MSQDTPRESDKLLDRAMARHQYSGDALLEVLHAAQQLYGYLSPLLLKTIAQQLKLPPSRVLGVATFYRLFRFAPAREHSATVCMGTACYAAGAQDLLPVLQCAGVHEWTLVAGRCVGSCGLAPIVILDDVVLSPMTPAQLGARLTGLHDV